MRAEENLEATAVATVTEEKRMRMVWNGETIVDLSREFLNSNGAEKHANVHARRGSLAAPVCRLHLRQKMEHLVGDLNVCSQKGLCERFDSTIGAATVLMPFGGKYQLTPSRPWRPSCPWTARPTPAPAWPGATTPT